MSGTGGGGSDTDTCVPWSRVGDFLLGGGVGPRDPKKLKVKYNYYTKTIRF